MDKPQVAPENLHKSFKKIDLNNNSYNKPPKHYLPSLQSSRMRGDLIAKEKALISMSSFEKPKPLSLVGLCLGLLGKHFEDIIEDLDVISCNFPPDIKMTLIAIAKRRKLLNDGVLIALAESSWEILDISDSDISDYGLAKVADLCKHVRAVDISRCSKITSRGVSQLIEHCHSLEILRWGGCPGSERAARRSLGLLKPTLNDVEGDSWEELDTTEIVHGAHSLRWLVWPKIDKDSLESLSTECPRVIVNPKPSLFGHRGVEVPREALLNVMLDEVIVKDIDPKTWAVPGSTIRTSSSVIELPIAERFRLAFVERDARLAPKRAKNARQHQRRAEKEWLITSARAKSLALAAQASRNLLNW